MAIHINGSLIKTVWATHRTCQARLYNEIDCNETNFIGLNSVVIEAQIESCSNLAGTSNNGIEYRSIKWNCIASDSLPNCTDLKEQNNLTTLVKGTTYSFSADYIGTVDKSGFVVAPTNCSISPTPAWIVNQTSISEPLPGINSWSWTPTEAGTFTVFCRAWNDGIAECRGDCVDGAPRYSCAGPNSKMTVTVVTPTPPTNPSATPTPPTGTPTGVPSGVPSGIPTVIPPDPNCTCNTGTVANNETCSNICPFAKFGDVPYTNPIKCSLPGSIFSSPPVDKNIWCNRSMRTKGDADGINGINSTDYFYYVSAVNGGKIPLAVNPDFNGDGEVGASDRAIIVKSLEPK